MSQWSIDPELSQRRLATLVRLLEAESERLYKTAVAGFRVAPGELNAEEMRQWTHQCRNIMGVATRPPRKADKRIEDKSDEELLS